MKKSFYTLLLSLMLCTVSAADYTISGVVCDKATGEGIPYATLSVSSAVDSLSYIKRFASNVDGKFDEQLAVAGRYKITISSVGYNLFTQWFELKEGEHKLNLGRLNLVESTDSISEVVVVAQKPLVKVELDKLTYDVENDPDAKSNTTLDMLRKVPMVTVDGDDEIQLKGSSNFKVYINGKPSNIVAKSPSQALKSIPASTIKEIEVITEPGAKYDAEGIGGIINIVTQHSLIGYVGSVRAGVDIYGSPNAGFYISSKIGKFGITANLNYYGSRRPGTESNTLREQFGDSNSKYIRQFNSGNQTQNYGFGTIEASYEIDSLDLISVSFGGNLGGQNYKSRGHSIIENMFNDTTVWYNSGDVNKSFWSGMSLSANYQRSFKKPQQLFTLSYQWDMSPNSQETLSRVDGVRNYASSYRKNLSRANGNEHTFQADYVEPFDNGRHTMEVGLKYILRDNYSVNDYYLEDTITQSWLRLPTEKNANLDQMQHIVSGYGSYSFKYEWFSLRVGARFEYTTQHVSADTSFSSQYFNVVPNAVLGFKLGQTQNLRVGYTQRLQRPGIWYLNPFYDNSNPFFIQQGNPDLNPTLSHNVSLSYGFFSQKFNLNTGLNYGFTNNSVMSVVSQLNDSVLYSTYANVGREMRGGLSLYMSWTIVQGVQLYVNGNGSYTVMDSQYGKPENIHSEGWGAQVHGGGQFQLPWKLRLGAYGGYGSPRVTLQGRGGDYYYYGLSVSRGFLKEKLNLSIRANNFANFRQRYNSYVQTDTYRYTQDYITNSGNVSFSISYRFGEMREQIKSVSRGIKNDDVSGGRSGGSEGGGGQ